MAPPNRSELDISKTSSHPPISASALEQDFWLLDQSGISPASLNLHVLIQASTAFDIGALTRALNSLVARMLSLRSHYFMQDGRVYKNVDTVPELLAVNTIGLGGTLSTQICTSDSVILEKDRILFDEDLAAAVIKRPHEVGEQIALPFDLRKGDLIRVCLFAQGDSIENTAAESKNAENKNAEGEIAEGRTSNERAKVLLVAMHPICASDCSFKDIVNELLLEYHRERNTETQLPPSVLQAEHEHHNYDNALESRWQDHLNDFSGYLPLVDYAQKLRSQALLLKPTEEPTRDELRVTVTQALSVDLLKWSDQYGVSIDLLVFLSIKIVLSRLLDEPKIIIGRSLSNESASVQGNKILPCATGVDELQSLGECLRIEAAAIDFVEENGAVTMGRLTRFASGRHKVGEAPIYQLSYSYRSKSDATRRVDNPQQGMRLLSATEQVRSTPLSIHVDLDDGLSWSFDYDAAQIPREFLAVLSSGLQALLRSIANVSDVDDVRLSELAIAHLTPDECAFAKSCERISHSSLLLPQRIEQSLRERPDKIVAQFQLGHDLTAARLEREASQLAAELIARGCERGQIVALALPRNDDLIIALYGLLKIGATYLPLDLNYPAARLQHMLEDSAARIVITDEIANCTNKGIDESCLDADVKVIEYDALRLSYAQRSESFASQANHEDIAYVIYTSGSTGKPKGVQVTQSALANFLQAMSDSPGIAPSDRLLAITTLSFDISVLELYLPLIAGAGLIVADSSCASDGRRLKALIEEFDINMLQATPSAWRLLLAAGFDGGPTFTALSGGEALSQDLSLALKSKVGRLYNMYGPTETTVWSSLSEVIDAEQEVELGKPIANTFFVVLNQKGVLLPRGAIGELCIGGAGLAQGYLNRPAMTKERFFSYCVGEGDLKGTQFRLYRTGDRAYQLSNGSVIGLGRLDNQIKLRGHRIELGEVETALQAHGAVEQAVALVSKANTLDHRLVLFYRTIGGNSLTNTEARSFLAERLPSFMLPQLTVPIPQFPLMPNRKIDRQALLDQLAAVPTARTGRIPQSEFQQSLAALWGKVLDSSEIHLDDRFFDVGGHSLIAMELLQDIEASYGRVLSLSDLIDNNFEQFAEKLMPATVIAHDNVQSAPLAEIPQGFLRRLLNLVVK